jgi:CheY-like chemotaxis protein
MLNDKRILIIDDSDTIRTYLQNVLSQKDAHQVDGAATGQEGLNRCLAQRYDLILLDQARRANHTLRGSAGTMRLRALYEWTTQVDKTLQEAAAGSLVLTQTHLDTMADLVKRIAAAGEETS